MGVGEFSWVLLDDSKTVLLVKVFSETLVSGSRVRQGHELNVFAIFRYPKF